MGVDTLVCACGMRLKAPGAVPGRVGKCPRCGSLLKVPEAPVEVESPRRTGPPPDRPTFIRRKGRPAKAPAPSKGQADGLVRPPAKAETRLVESFSYPLWDASGLAVLFFVPSGMWAATVPMFGVVPAVFSGSPLGVLALVLLIPQLLLLLFVGGNALRFLGQVLVTSSLGEVNLPRSPSWSLHDLGATLWPWSWALLIGGGLGGLPALAYWINCGDVDWVDRIILVDLVVPGLAYAQMALLAALMHETPLAANPITILRAIFRVGWAYASPCFLSASILVVLGGLFAAVLAIRDEFGQAIAYWAYWVASTYAAMVVLRRLGLFCYRHAVVLDWFPDRSRPAP